MSGLLLAITCAVIYGTADFAGGLAARGAHVLRVVAIAAPVSFLISVALVPVFGASFGGKVLLWGAVSGVSSAVGFVLLYRTLALGPMSVVSPVTAVVSAVIPVGVGLAQGKRPGAAALIGIPLAFIAIVLVSAAPSGDGARPSRAALSFALGAGAAISIQLIAFHEAPASSGVAPLVVARGVASVLLVVAALARRGHLGVERPSLRLSAAAGALDGFANLAFLLAVRRADLTVVAVIAALYPAATVVLARLVLHERLHRTQLIGLGVAAAAVALLATA